ncbi:nicotinamide riboside transporter PnuC [Tenuifilum thalassicum]|uniref:Nicotinamide riboside transporter PnuC n=1 Tax=Tenuifilum thalassicum TaxID=2590900 RepID=A0A7D3Y0K5_9BACT|nr:nicotinamide riboside transporter PnuC [Tenuifilum thalassicum]QKG80533.1 nicotinamide mononucleotide transporter [Tenuifilum thalassicum]
MSWISNNYIELIGAITGLIYLYLEIKQKVWLWPLGILTSAFYIYIFYVSKFYADMGLQWYYLIISIYGWYHWLFGGNANSKNSLPVTNTPKRFVVPLVVASAVLFVLIRFVLTTYTDSPVPTGDAFTTALSITATWMLARKYIEHWWIWVVVNSVSLILYIYKGLYPTSVLFLFYTIMSFVGYSQWKNEKKCN